jgi:hypothetical protein
MVEESEHAFLSTSAATTGNPATSAGNRAESGVSIGTTSGRSPSVTVT